MSENRMVGLAGSEDYYPVVCFDCSKPKSVKEGRFNTYYIGRVGDVRLFECNDCLGKKEKESTQAVNILREAMK